MNKTVTYKENLRSIVLDIEEYLHLNDPKLSITYLKTMNIQIFNTLEIKPEVILSLLTHLSNDLTNTIEMKLSFLIICLKKLSTQKIPSTFNYIFEDYKKEILTDKDINIQSRTIKVTFTCIVFMSKQYFTLKTLNFFSIRTSIF